jgi:hypothetical protein
MVFWPSAVDTTSGLQRVVHIGCAIVMNFQQTACETEFQQWEEFLSILDSAD